MIRINAIQVDDTVLDRIETDGVTFGEVEEACHALARHARQGPSALHIFSELSDGRHLYVGLAHLGGDAWRLVAARDMEDRERRMFQRERGK